MPDSADTSAPQPSKSVTAPDGPVVAVVIPSYRVARHIANVINGIPGFVRHIVVVDDACPDDSGKIAEATGDPRLVVLRHDKNQGVGGATVTGYRWAVDNGVDIAVKMDGDDQMDPALLPDIVAPVARDQADYAKGNRFRDFRALRSMPRQRLFANAMLSFAVKWASGYWNVMDPTNGYTAISSDMLRAMELDRIERRYFFESDMLIRLNPLNAVVADVSMPARYGDEQSSIKAHNVLASFPGKLLKGAIRRVFLRYFIYDFNMASVYMLLGLPLFLFGIVFGAITWIDSIASDIAQPVGTIMLAVLPIILGFQMLLQAVNIDIVSVPARRTGQPLPAGLLDAMRSALAPRKD